jgi:dienelactone hydrolase
MSASKGLRALAALAMSLLATLSAAQERVSFPSFDGAGNAPVVLNGFFFRAPTSPAPAIAMFHGCSGAYDKSGALARRMHQYAELFNGLGMHVLVVDSLTARYEKELCTQRNGKRRVTQANRRLDALGAMAYLADRADVDAKRIGLIGWSNGGSTVLSATNLHHHDVAAAVVKPAFAIAF